VSGAGGSRAEQCLGLESNRPLRTRKSKANKRKDLYKQLRNEKYRLTLCTLENKKFLPHKKTDG